MKTTKKQQSISRAVSAYEELCNYRGIPFRDTDICINERWSIAKIDNLTKSLMEQAKQPLQPATEKQMNYIMSLVKDWKDQHLFDGIALNKFQAFELINIYKYANDLLYSKSTFSGCKEVWDDIDNEINLIINSKTL